MFDCFWLSVPVQLIAWKDSPPNDLLCDEWDVKPYTLTHSLGLSLLCQLGQVSFCLSCTLLASDSCLMLDYVRIINFCIIIIIIICSVFPCFWLSVPVQFVAWKDSSPKWFIICRVGCLTLITYSQCFSDQGIRASQSSGIKCTVTLSIMLLSQNTTICKVRSAGGQCITV